MYIIFKKYGALAIGIFHLIGIIGLSSEYRGVFLNLTPVNLIASTIIIAFDLDKNNKRQLIFCLVCFFTCFFIEVIGVNTGIIFGEYEYGNTLGIKFLGTPLLIGVNWLLLILSIGSMLSKVELNLFLKCITSAFLMVFIDFFIEPIAMILDFWNWKNSNIPPLNYFAWFYISLIIFFLYFKIFKNEDENKIIKYVYSIQLAFFLILNLIF